MAMRCRYSKFLHTVQLNGANVLQGLTEEAARSKMWLFDSKGLIAEGREGLSTDKQVYAQPAAALKGVGLVPGASLGHAVRAIKPTCLVGATGKAGVFTPEILKDVYQHMPASKVLASASSVSGSDLGMDIELGTTRGRRRQRGEGQFASMPPGSGSLASLRATPIVLALSNPTNCSECTLQDTLDSMDGNCIFASGSPFPPAKGVDGVRVEAAQANNAMIFPGLGAGAILSGASEIPPSCFLEAGRALADELTEDELVAGLAIPSVSRIRDAALAVAAAVCIECQQTMTASNTGNNKVWRQAAAVLESEKGGDVIDVEARALLRKAIIDWRY
jgi:malate dehydrogenase (oxaloacetate-decarboxylating)(NADP+)